MLVGKVTVLYHNNDKTGKVTSSSAWTHLAVWHNIAQIWKTSDLSYLFLPGIEPSRHRGSTVKVLYRFLLWVIILPIKKLYQKGNLTVYSQKACLYSLRIPEFKLIFSSIHLFSHLSTETGLSINIFNWSDTIKAQLNL